MALPRRLLCLLGLVPQLARAGVQDVLAAADASALVQREARLQRSAGDLSPQVWRFKRMRLTPRLARTILRTAVSQVQAQLQEHEETLDGQLSAARAVNQYVHKVKSVLGRRGTLFGEVAGLMPKGQLDEADRAVAMALLGLFRNETFSSAVINGIKGLSEQVTQYRWRNTKHVAELVVQSANATDKKLPQLLKGFFGNQHHVMSSALKAADKSLRTILAALPENYTVMAEIGSSTVDQLIGHAQQALQNNTEAILQTHGSKFCGGLDLMMSEDLLPIANQTVLALRGADTFAQANMPEVVPQVTKLLKALSGLSDALTKVRSETGSWIERVCGLVGAMSVE